MTHEEETLVLNEDLAIKYRDLSHGDCEWCGKPVRWDESQVSTWGKNFWHTACFNAEQAAFGRGQHEEYAS